MAGHPEEVEAHREAVSVCEIWLALRQAAEKAEVEAVEAKQRVDEAILEAAKCRTILRSDEQVVEDCLHARALDRIACDLRAKATRLADDARAVFYELPQRYVLDGDDAT